MRTVHAVVPDGIDDPQRPSGGNRYDRRLLDELAILGWTVREHPVLGAWPHPDDRALAALHATMAQIADRTPVLLDGLIASTAPEILAPQARRVRQVVLVHMPLGHRPGPAEADAVRHREEAVLHAASAVVTTSAWTQRRLSELYAVPAERIRVAPPGVDAAAPAAGSQSGVGGLLCVAAVTYGKGHDVLVQALSGLADLPWRCRCVGSLDRDPCFADAVRRQARDAGLRQRIAFVGPLTGAALDAAYAASDLMVLPSRAETYGMVITEALARGLPVIASEVGGTSESLGHGQANTLRPGILLAPDDPGALRGALHAWLTDAALRARLRQAARERRAGLTGWAATAAIVARALDGPAR